MKKIGKKLSFLTKIMLVIGLLISNLSSLSVVFAYEVVCDVVVALNEEVLEISYNKELSEEVEAVDVKVYENYSFLDGESIEEVVTNYSLSEEELVDAVEGNLKLEIDSIFALEEEMVSEYKLFDGRYSVKVEIVDMTTIENSVEEVNVDETLVLNDANETELQNNEIDEVGTVLSCGTYEKEVNHKQGLDIKLYNFNDNSEIELVDGKYQVEESFSKVSVVAQVLSGGLNPSDVFMVNEEEYTAYELLQKGFSQDVDFNGRLFGEYNIPVEVNLLKLLPVVDEEISVSPEVTDSELVNDDILDNTEELVYTDSVSVMYGTYASNDSVLNDIALSNGYSDTYLFYSESQEGILYVLSEFEEEVLVLSEEEVVTRTMLDLYNIINLALDYEEDEETIITYKLFKNGIDVLESYEPINEEDTLEKYLSTILLDDTVVVEISNDGLTINYRVVISGDLDNDNLLTKEDVLLLIDQFVGKTEIADMSESDVYRLDGEVTFLDVLYLNQVVNNKNWSSLIMPENASLNASLNVSNGNGELTEENYLTSGDEFKVDYVLSLSDYEVNGVAGLFDFDKSLFELMSVDVNYEWIGNSNDGKFIYLGEESLTGPELEDTENTEDENTQVLSAALLTDTEEVVTEDYVLISATFRALKATDENSNNVIVLKEIELFNSTDKVTYYVLDKNEVLTDEISVTASADNSLSYLEIAGVEITLEENVFEYEITVPSDVTAVDLKYILGNVAASVTSEVYPEELSEGNNTIVITVTSENGVSQDYTITVIKEKAVTETTTYVNYDDYNNDEDTTGGVVVTPGESDKDDEDDETEKEGNLSKIIIVILILVVIAGLVYLIFKDDDEDTKKANKEINKLKKESVEPEVKEVEKTTAKTSDNNSDRKTSNKTSNNNKNKNSKKNSNNKK